MKTKIFLFLFICISGFTIYAIGGAKEPTAIRKTLLNEQPTDVNSDNLAASPFEKRVEAGGENLLKAMGVETKKKEDTKKTTVIYITPEKRAELMGELDSEYKIRKDIVQFIKKAVPSENKQALKAALKHAEYVNMAYYLSENQAEALAVIKREGLSMFCLVLAYPDKWLEISRGIEKLMRNTPERDKHMWEVDSKYFGGHALGTGLVDSEERERCRSGNF